MSSKVIPITDQLLENGIIIARCPECNHDRWYIKLNALGDRWDAITGTVCANDKCNFTIDWVRAEK